MHRPLTPPALILALLAFAASVVACSLKPGERPALPLPIAVDTVPAAERCRFPLTPAVVKTQGHALLQYWELEERGPWSEPLLPTDSAYTRYRRHIEEAGADQARPLQHVPEAERDNENWHRERYNVERAYSTQAGTLRPVRCLDALLFAYQNARYAQIDQPTEFLVSILRKRIEGRTVLRVYFGASDELFPPRTSTASTRSGAMWLPAGSTWRCSTTTPSKK